jgi:hypothetical protein
VSNTVYKQAAQGIISGGIDLDTDVIKIALVNTYTPNINTHRMLSDLTTSGGVIAATSPALTSVTAVDGVFGAANPTFTSVSAGTACGYLVFYKDTGTPSTSQLILYIDTATGLPVTPNGGNIALTFDTGANKIVNWSP